MIDWKALAAPFPPTDVEWRISQVFRNQGGVKAKCLAYITNRAIQDRLDQVVGPGNWKNEYQPWEIGTPGVLCGISIWDDDKKEWITKWDGAEQTDVEAMKGGLSASMKRAAVQWGVGRYLYDLPAGWAIITENGQYHAGKGDEAFRWNPPPLPTWALPDGNGKAGSALGTPQLAGDSAVQIPTQPSPQSEVPTRIPGPYAPTEKQIAFYQSLTTSHVFTEDERKNFLEWLATKATRQTIKVQIDWLKESIQIREAERRDAPA